jgi:hypothetical protein
MFIPLVCKSHSGAPHACQTAFEYVDPMWTRMHCAGALPRAYLQQSYRGHSNRIEVALPLFLKSES